MTEVLKNVAPNFESLLISGKSQIWESTMVGRNHVALL